MAVNVDWPNAIAGAILGVVVSGIVGTAIRAYTTLLDFVPRRLTAIGVGSSFEAFYARGPGDNYDAVLRIAIRNLGGAPLFVARAVYIPDDAGVVPVYVEARRSQKYPQGYELKFGTQWQEASSLVTSYVEVNTYLPLSAKPDGRQIPPGKRGKLLLEYIYDGKPGIHRGRI